MDVQSVHIKQQVLNNIYKRFLSNYMWIYLCFDALNHERHERHVLSTTHMWLLKTFEGQKLANSSFKTMSVHSGINLSSTNASGLG